MLELVRLVQATLVAALRCRRHLVVENLLLRQQLQVALRSQRRPHLGTRDKLFWLLVRRLHRDWRRHLFLVRPETVLGWHRRGWRLFWRWRSGRALGRPRLKAEVRELIATMARQNPHWGSERIRGEQPSYLIHDRDRVYGADFAVRWPASASRASAHPSKRLGRTPSLNASCEACAGSAWITSCR